jgi:predicted RNase H-like nuclease
MAQFSAKVREATAVFPKTTILYGIDGCTGGWLRVTSDAEGRLAARVVADASGLVRPAVDIIVAIDIPIGLPSAGSRRCDLEARSILGPRRSSVFPAPPRCTLAAPSYADACAASAEACGKRLSKQTYAILPKIREVDALLCAAPSLLQVVHEVHPEVSFAHWNAGRPMHHPKQSGFGFLERFRLVNDVFPGAAEAIRESIPRSQAFDDDILDALAALWTARRIRDGVAVRLGNPIEHDDRGLPMHIWA